MIITRQARDYERRRNDWKLRVYIGDGDQLTEIVDKYFIENIMPLKVKSRAWSKVKKALTSIVSRKFAARFNVPLEHVKYNTNCGCTCGCSPGYCIITSDVRYMSNNCWVSDIEYTDQEVQSIKDLLRSDKLNELLMKDKAMDAGENSDQ